MYKSAEAAGYTGKIYTFDATQGGTNSGSASGGGLRGGTTGTVFTGILWSNLLDKFFKGYESKWNGASTATNALRAVADSSLNPTSGALAGIADANARAVSVGGIAYPRLCIPSAFLYNNQVESPTLASASEYSKGGVIDSFEAELNYGTETGTADATWNSESRTGKLAYRAFKLMFEKAGVAEKLIKDGYSVTAYKNGVAENTRINVNNYKTQLANDLPMHASEGGLSSTVTENTFIGTSGTMTHSAFGLDVSFIARKDDEKLTVVYNYFENAAAVDAALAALTSAASAERTAREALITTYKTYNLHTAGTLALVKGSTKQGNAVYFGTAGAITDFKAALGL